MLSPERKALLLAVFTVGYNLAEGVVSLVAARMADSQALFGFGLDSFVESLSGCVIIWRFWKYGPAADEDQHARAERTAIRLVGYSFLVLGGYVLFDALWALYRQETPQASLLGIAIAVASIIVMPVLFLLKYRLGKSMGSRSLMADAKETLACMLLSVALLVGLVGFYIWRIWWIDPAVAIIIAILILREGRETLAEVEPE